MENYIVFEESRLLINNSDNIKSNNCNDDNNIKSNDNNNIKSNDDNNIKINDNNNIKHYVKNIYEKLKQRYVTIGFCILLLCNCFWTIMQYKFTVLNTYLEGGAAVQAIFTSYDDNGQLSTCSAKSTYKITLRITLFFIT